MSRPVDLHSRDLLVGMTGRHSAWSIAFHRNKYSEYAIAYMADDTDSPLASFTGGYEDAPAAVLTPAQREYFVGERQVEGASERALLSRVRQRIRASSSDFSLLIREYTNNEFDKLRPEGKRPHPTDSLAGFLYAAQPREGMIVEDVMGDDDPPNRDRRAAWMEKIISRGVEKAIEHREGRDSTVEVSIKVDREENLKDLAEGDLSRLSRDQLDSLLYTGTITRESYAEANKRRLNREFGGK